MASTIGCIDFADIDRALDCIDGNIGGCVQNLIYGFTDDVMTWPTKPAKPATGNLALDAAGVLVGDLVMNAGTRAFKLEATEDTVNLAISVAGEIDAEYVQYDLSLIQAKIKAQILGFMNAAKGRDLFFIVEDNNGTMYLLGDAKRGARIQPSNGATTGTKRGADRNQTELKFQYISNLALVYSGDVKNMLVVVPAV